MSKANNSTRGRSVVKWILWVLLFQFVLINISASLHAWKQTHFYTDPALRVIKPGSKNVFLKTWKLFAGLKYPRSVIRKSPEFPVDAIQLHTRSGLMIDCWYSHPDTTAKGTVILFHGLGGNKSYLLSEAAEFRYLGYNLLLVDLRGHGGSDGNVTSIGYRESEEVKLAYDYIVQKWETNIFLYGMSMGAVVIAKAFQDYQIKPAGVILEMPIASLQTFLEARSRVMGFPSEPFGFLVTGWIGIEEGFNGYGHNPYEYAKKITCPALIQWGSHDPFVLPSQIQHVYSNIPGTHKRLVVYENADHQSLLGFDPVKWREEVSSLLANPGSLHPTIATR